MDKSLLWSLGYITSALVSLILAFVFLAHMYLTYQFDSIKRSNAAYYGLLKRDIETLKNREKP